jgi:FKBP-type peptidyl-prolyl cis-trans isomerase
VFGFLRRLLSPAMNADLSAPADVAAPPADATTTSTGLAWKSLTPGTGDRPSAAANVTVHYSGWTTDGKLFDSSLRRGQPTSFPLNRVIAGWTEGLQLMQQGETARFWIPADLAYGEKPGGGRPGGMLCFDVQLLSFVEPPPPPVTPTDLNSPPAGSTRTGSGLTKAVLRAGTGTQKPGARSSVTVHYSGWTLDGRMFDSSVTRGEPATFPLNRVIAGWTEGLQMMVVGEKARFWIPARLAYGDNPGGGRPGGLLVFDVELLSIG